MKICGIDPGKKGGISILDNGKVTDCIIMPTNETTIDFREVYLYIQSKKADCIYIENVHAMPKQGVCSMFNFGFSTGGLHAIAACLNTEINLVTPQKWKKTLFGPDYAEGKDQGIELCNRFAPNINLLPTKRSKKPHDGMSDAICISYFGFLDKNNINNKKQEI